MSYSFGFKADNAAAAKAEVVRRFDTDVVAPQPIHARDRQQAIDNAHAAIDRLGAPGPDDCIYVSMSGSLGWRYDDGKSDPLYAAITSCNVSATAYLQRREI